MSWFRYNIPLPHENEKTFPDYWDLTPLEGSFVVLVLSQVTYVKSTFPKGTKMGHPFIISLQFRQLRETPFAVIHYHQ